MTKAFFFDKTSHDHSVGAGGWLKEVNGVNGSSRSIAPGFPNLDDQMNQMGITHFRFHDNLGFGDIDNYFVKNDKSSQFLPNIPILKQKAALSLIADLGNYRTIYPNAAIGMQYHKLDLALSKANYAMTDRHFKRMMDNEAELNPMNLRREIMFRVGRTNRGGGELPKDNDIYAALVRNLVTRYSVNFKDIGLPRRIKYWEIWNGPDLTMFWNNSDPSTYFSFYEKVVKAIKSADPLAKVGGPGALVGDERSQIYIDNFLAYCRNNGVPIDFLSWHYYGHLTSDPQSTLDIGEQMQNVLDKYGYEYVESICTEWNSTPYAGENIFSKLQSAKNAAYIASSFIYMNYTKVDKAYYYRGDSLSFGLFNDESTFCTYAAQAFYFYNKLFETPKLLQSNHDFSSGLTILAGTNEAGNKINILAANCEVDPSLSDQSAPTESKIYKQYYLDGNRQMKQLTDKYSLEQWFYDVNPLKIHPNNEVKQKPTIEQILKEGNIPIHKRDYSQSHYGAKISLHNINYPYYRLTVKRIYEGGQLWTMDGEDVTNSVHSWIDNGNLILIDEGAIRSTVTLYTIDLIH